MDCGDDAGQNGEFQGKYDEILEVMNNFNTMRIDPEDELSKVVNGFKTLKIDTRDAEEKLEVEKLITKFKDIKLEVNKTFKKFKDLKVIFNSLSPDEYQINYHELYQVALDGINKFEADILYQELLFNKIESHFQLIFDKWEKEN
ncbi:hypothetical protein RYX36_020556 [Vicia faba]